MAENGRVFISHSHDDNERCEPLLAALDAWGADYFFDTQGLGAGQQLHEIIQREIAGRDIFLRVCTAATLRSFWMSLEANAFRGLQSEDRRRGGADHRLLINLILSGDYTREPFDNATLFIDAANRPRQVWMAELARALNVAMPRPRRGVSRRAVVAYAAAAAVTLTSTAAAGALFLDDRSRAAAQTQIATKSFPGTQAWKILQASAKKDIPPVPAVAGTTAFVMTGAAITAYDFAHILHGAPRMLWSKPLSPKFRYVAPTVHGDTLYVGLDWTVYALSVHDGRELWTITLPKGDSGTLDATPFVVGDALYLFSQTGHLYAFEAKTAVPRWTVTVDTTRFFLDHASGVAVDSTSIYIGSVDHNFYALNLTTGAQRWKVPMRGKVISTPSIIEGVIYVGSNDNHVYAINAHDGSIKWKYLTGDDVESSPAVVDGVVYVASDDHYLYALDAAIGKPYWRAPIGDLDSSSGIIDNSGPVTCQPAVTGDAVCVIDTTNNIVRSFSRHDGVQRWMFKSASFQNADPVATNGLIIFGSGDQTLYAFGA